MNYLLGYDIGSSSVKASLINAETGAYVATAFYPKTEMEIKAPISGWAEQDPQTWWVNLKQASADVFKTSGISASEVLAIGISYQMHGLVAVDKQGEVVRPSIIWCDSRAVEIGNNAFAQLGAETCLSQLLNSPGNFTASKLKWVKDNEPELYSRIHKIMLPGDYIAYKLSGQMQTTESGLSEGMLWNIKENRLADFLLSHYGIDASLIAEIVPTFSIQSRVSKQAASELGLAEGTPISYRAGDQPNNALSLNVLNPGEIAATAGTSGVVYGVSSQVTYDPQSRVNSFIHVNHTNKQTRLGVLLCVNGTGILNSWVKRVAGVGIDYAEMNELAADVSIGSDGLVLLPFGNGAERMLGNKNVGASVNGLNFNIHGKAHLFRAAQEGIVFSLNYGIEVMRGMGIQPSVIRAGHANMFLSPLFRETLAGVSGATIELYDTDGSKGAALAAGVGCGYYASFDQAFSGLTKIAVVEPDKSKTEAYKAAYENWKTVLNNSLS